MVFRHLRILDKYFYIIFEYLLVISKLLLSLYRQITQTMENTQSITWVPVSEKTPENYDFVLVTINPGNGEKWVEIAGFANGKFQTPQGVNSEFVTHWANKPTAA